jgi:hypothetical protein
LFPQNASGRAEQSHHVARDTGAIPDWRWVELEFGEGLLFRPAQNTALAGASSTSA